MRCVHVCARTRAACVCLCGRASAPGVQEGWRGKRCTRARVRPTCTSGSPTPSAHAQQRHAKHIFKNTSSKRLDKSQNFSVQICAHLVKLWAQKAKLNDVIALGAVLHQRVKITCNSPASVRGVDTSARTVLFMQRRRGRGVGGQVHLD